MQAFPVFLFLPKCFYVYQLYLILLNVLVTLCHRLPLLLYQQVISCWFDQQRTVSLKPNTSLCVRVVSLWSGIMYNKYGAL